MLDFLFEINDVKAVYMVFFKQLTDQKLIMLNPALTNFKGLRNLICYRRNSVKTIYIGNEKKTYSRVHELAIAVGGIPIMAGPLES